jgi:5'-3' exonuclease
MAILIDTSHGMSRTLYMNKDAVCQNYEFLAHLLLTQFNSVASKFGASKENPLVLCIDAKSWRKDYYEEHKKDIPELANESYKGHRVKDDTINWDEIYAVTDGVIDCLKEFSDYHVVKVEKAEADDVIAVLSDYFKAKKQQVWIISSDKDFIQLQDEDKVSIYDPIKQIFRPHQDIDLYKKIHIMIGDSVDNIKAIKPRLGEKTAVKIVKDLDTLLQTNPDMKAKWDFNQTLIDFDYIPQSIKTAIIDEYETQKFSYNAMKLIGSFAKYKLVKHVEGVDRFKLPDHAVKTNLNSLHATNKRNAELSTSTLEDFFS